MIRRVLLVLALAAAGLVVATPATASTALVAAETPVYVDVRGVSSNWRVGEAIALVDRYTRTDARFGACRSGYKCVIIRERYVRSDWSAVTTNAIGYHHPASRIYIYLNPYREGRYTTTTLRNIVTHEAGHAWGITWHSYSCTNVMYYRVFCASGARPSWSFLTNQRYRLSRN